VRVVGQVAEGRAPISFTIEPYFGGGFVLNLDIEHHSARAGHWPTPEKAQEIAQRIAAQVLEGATVAWDSPDSAH
jgi:hypothetical protein